MLTVADIDAYESAIVRLSEHTVSYDAGLAQLCADWRELRAQVAALTAQLAEMTADRDSEQRWACEYFSETLKLEAQVVALTAELDAARKAAGELFAFDEQAHKHWTQYTPATRALLERLTVEGLAAARQAAKE